MSLPKSGHSPKVRASGVLPEETGSIPVGRTKHDTEE